jgi:hypothetical protein
MAEAARLVGCPIEQVLRLNGAIGVSLPIEHRNAPRSRSPRLRRPGCRRGAQSRRPIPSMKRPFGDDRRPHRRHRRHGQGLGDEPMMATMPPVTTDASVPKPLPTAHWRKRSTTRSTITVDGSADERLRDPARERNGRRRRGRLELRSLRRPGRLSRAGARHVRGGEERPSSSPSR